MFIFLSVVDIVGMFFSLRYCIWNIVELLLLRKIKNKVYRRNKMGIFNIYYLGL